MSRTRVEVRVDLRLATGWSKEILTSPNDPLVLNEYGLSCKVSDLYRGTPLEAPEGSKS